ncbi:MAG: chorismate synthase [Clostridia bacterium]|nr:chorismate synthase [Clostridia bacterium]
MKNSFGSSVSVTLYGESHGAAVGCVLDGMAPGISVDEGYLAKQMSLRRSVSSLSTPRKEADKVRILSGVYQGKTTGTPICMMIENGNTHSADYAKTADLLRPGHADYTARIKYHGYADPNGGGHFSGRITAGLVAAGAIALTALREKGIVIGTHIAACGGVCDRPFSPDPRAELEALADAPFAVLDEAASTAMQAKIIEARAAGDSVGGILESAVCGLPAGVGEPWFDTLESVLSHILFSIPAVKGVEFGDGFALSAMRGSEANDPFRIENGAVVTSTNRMGGILGGISNGMPLRIRTAIKPTPSISLSQPSVNMATGENEEISVVGRHDPAIVHRARVVADSAIALVLCDMLSLRFGTDYLKPND